MEGTASVRALFSCSDASTLNRQTMTHDPGWNYHDIPCLDTDLVMHTLVVTRPCTRPYIIVSLGQGTLYHELNPDCCHTWPFAPMHTVHAAKALLTIFSAQLHRMLQICSAGKHAIYSTLLAVHVVDSKSETKDA